MEKNSMRERCIRPALASAVVVLLILSLFTPALTSERASTPDQAELDRMLNDACGRCHNLNRVILESGKWKLKDWLHAFDSMAKSTDLSKKEKTSIAGYLDSHRQEIGLAWSDEQDKPDTMRIDTYYVLFENRCVVCHKAEKIDDCVPEDLSREDLKHIVDRMVKKAPHFLDGVNTENIVDYLHGSQPYPEKTAAPPCNE